LFAWMTLHSIPEETIISPHILQFLEQALEPIPITLPESKPVSSNENGGIAGVFNFDGSSSTAATSASSTGVASGSFPVDVVVYCHVQPSTFRFSCLPESRVECLLRLPSLHLVFSSKRSEDQVNKEEFYPKPTNVVSTVGGLSVTGCLSDFSLYIFHPYGGAKKSGGSSRRDGNQSDRSSDAESERKDSLSVNVEFVKFHLSRSRKVNFVPVGRSATDGSSSSRNGRESAVDPAKAVVRFSTLIDIGSASFKYDMRRLPEILAFPKAWYRRTIVRRLFLGDLSKNDPSDLLPPSGRDLAPGLSRWAELQPDQAGLSQISSWETLVVFAVNFTKLNVHMNMGNVMGNVSWLTKDFKAEGRLSIGSTGHKDMYIGIGLEGSGLDAKGGIVGGTIELSGIHTSLAIREDPGMEPDHRLAVQLRALECRLDYMGTSVLMGRVSVLAVDLRDEWRVGNLVQNERVQVRRSSLASSPTKRPAMIFIHGDLGWDQLQLMMSKSTTADLIKMYLKLDEFFQQQFRSSRRIFSTLHSATSLRRKGPTKVAKSVVESGLEAQHHQHWQEVLRRVAGLQVATLPTPLPSTGTILGGTMELHGDHISLACFHGVNFKSKSWALFSLKDPCISFATEAQEIPGEGKFHDIHVNQFSS
jgi:Fragile site-associated protein C-terminus